MKTLPALLTRVTEQAQQIAAPKHRAPYDRTIDILRKNGSVVPARHSTNPTTMRAWVTR